MKNILLTLCFILSTSLLMAGPDERWKATPVFDDYGNQCRDVGILISSSAVTEISSPMRNEGITTADGIPVYRWRFRQLINRTGGMVMITRSRTRTTYSENFGVHLSSGAGNQGEAYTVPGNGWVGAILSPGSANGVITGVECWSDESVTP